MAQIRIPCLVGKTNKAGVTSWYWQPSKTLAAAGWTALTLGKDEGAALVAARARNAEVELWKAGGPRPEAVTRRRDPGSLAAGIARYRREVMEGKKPNGSPLLKPKTKAVYATSIDRLEAWAGQHPIAYVTPLRVRKLRDATAKPIEQGGLGHAAAFNLLCQGRQLFAFFESVDLIPKGSNPFTSFGLGKPPARSTVWHADDDAAFDAAAYDLGLPGMALAREVALFSAQRQGDLIAFTEAQFGELEIFDPILRDRLAGEDGKVMGWTMNQAKTSNDYVQVGLEIPFEPRLAERVAAAIRTNRARDRAAEPRRLLSYVLVDDRTGKPWKQRAFYDAFALVLAHAAKQAERPQMLELTWHDLRRTRVVRLRRRGMPKEMIASITGHSLQSIEEMLKVYGPVDATITAQAIAATLEPAPAQDTAKKPSNKIG